MNTRPLHTGKDLLLLHTVRRLTEDNEGDGPTIREIAAAMGFASPQTAHRRVKALRQQGWLTNKPGRARAIKILHPEDLPPLEWDYGAIAESLQELLSWMEDERGPLHALWANERIPGDSFPEAVEWARNPENRAKPVAVRVYRSVLRSLGVRPAGPAAPKEHEK